MGEGGLHLDLIGNVVLGGSNSGNTLTLKYNVFDGNWRHVVVTYDSVHRFAELFVDGQVVLREELFAAFPVRLTTVCIGEQRPECKIQYPSRFPEGQLEAIALHSRLLSPEEAMSMFARGR